MNQNYEKVNLKDSNNNTTLYAKTMASCIYFSDGETLQQKFDNGLLSNPEVFNGLQAVSPTLEVAENSDDSFKLKIKDINGYIITPNLIGPKGPKGDTVNADGQIVPSIQTYEYSFMSNDMEKITDDVYFLRVNRAQHKLGFGAKVTEVFRYMSDTELVNVLYSYKRLVNGDILFIFNEPFAGIACLEGDNNQ